MKVLRTTSGHALLSDASYVRRCTRRLATTAVSSSVALLLAAPIQAQEQPAQPQADIIEEIQVTGSRIERTGFTTPVPVTTMQMEELSFFEPAGGLSEQLSELPQFIGNQTPNQASVLFGTAGQSRVNMRGMGSERTLVLLDGIRIVPSDRDSSVNPDYLPSALIRRVEVVTGGASAAYGADALAGVTNFIIDREFTGFAAASATSTKCGGHRIGATSTTRNGWRPLLPSARRARKPASSCRSG
jgi:iron complex outermembrane recepter protein